jgi:cell division protein FtsZ
LSFRNAFAKADSVLTIAAKGIAEIITKTGDVNVDLNDVRTIMTNSGDVVMGSGTAAGPDRAVEAIKKSLDSPLLLSTNIQGAKKILLNISYGVEEITMDELKIITGYMQKQVGAQPGMVNFGILYDETLGEELSVTMVATGFNLNVQDISDQIQSQGSNRYQPQEPQKPEPPKEEKRINMEYYYGKNGNNTTGRTPSRTAYQGTTTVCEEPKRIVTLDLDDDANLDQMENIPAYKRKQQGGDASGAEQLSSDNISRFSIGKEGDELKLNKNDYLHNKPD